MCALVRRINTLFSKKKVYVVVRVVYVVVRVVYVVVRVVYVVVRVVYVVFCSDSFPVRNGSFEGFSNYLRNLDSGSFEGFEGFIRKVCD